MTILQLNEFTVFSLKPFNIKVENEVVCLHGASGSGKSLLLKAIVDLIEHEGDAVLNEENCQDVSPVQWRKWVGFLPAESAWWLDKVGDHFKNKKSEYLSALNLPDDSLGWECSRCSTGEKQRLAIARLLENKPKVLLLDEPTASLDQKSVLAVETLIKKYITENNAAVIWVSHDDQQVKRVAQREFKIEKNEIIEVTA